MDSEKGEFEMDITSLRHLDLQWKVKNKISYDIFAKNLHYLLKYLGAI